MCEGTGAPQTCWEDLAQSQPDPGLQALNRGVPVRSLACHRALCSPRTGSKTMRLCRGWLSPAASLACSVHPGTTDALTAISGSQARDASSFLLLPCHHLSLSKSLFHPASSAILYLSFKQFCHPLTPFPDVSVAPLPQNGVKLIPAVRSREERTASFPASLCGMPLCLGRGGKMQDNL